MPLDFNPLEMALTQAEQYLRSNGGMQSEDDPSSPEYVKKKARQKKIDEYQAQLAQQSAQRNAVPGQLPGGFQMNQQQSQQTGSMLSSLLGMFSGGGGGSYSPGAANMLF